MHHNEYDSKFQKVTLERMAYAVQIAIARDYLEDGFAIQPKVDHFIDDISHSIVFRLRQDILGEKLKEEKVSFPADWKESLKEWIYDWLSWPGGGHWPWLGDHLKRRYPVRIRFIEMNAVALYPKISLPDHSYYVHIVKFDNTQSLRYRNKNH